MALRGNRLFVTGRVQSALNRFDVFVRSYDVSSGTILWQDCVDVGNLDLASGIARPFPLRGLRAGDPGRAMRTDRRTADPGR